MAKRLPPYEANGSWPVANQVDSQPAYQAEAEASTPLNPPRHALCEVIRSRIRQRLGDRVRELGVEVDGDGVVLRGRCATYYTKQLAQHAALGVLNNEPLHNKIVVMLK